MANMLREELKRGYENIPNELKSIIPTQTLNVLKTLDLDKETFVIMDKYKINEIKKLVYKNHGIVQGNKSLKKNWANALLYTRRYAFNTFALRSNISDDVLRNINKYV
jgi:hypothetical protein